MKRIAITTGDPAGIGPEIVRKSLQFRKLCDDICYVVYGRDPQLPLVTRIEKIEDAYQHGKIYYIEKDDPQIKAGEPSDESGVIAYNILESVQKDIKKGKIDAVATAPVSKKYIQKTKPKFIGHTEFFRDKSQSDEVIMSFWGDKFKLCLLTTHLALKNVSKQINKNFLETKFNIIFRELPRFISKKKIKIAVLALNPHAGEAGAFGDEDLILEDFINNHEEKKCKLEGPFPADTFFRKKIQDYDVIVSAYHDQGLIPFKMIHPDNGVNVTLGLPFLRSSVDHGTAFDIAGKDVASERSMERALEFLERQLSKSKMSESLVQYNEFAPYYDKYMEHVHYKKWIRFILGKYSKLRKKRPDCVLELACGTANIASELVKKGLNVYALDKSQEMLKVGFNKKYSPKLLNKDMLDPLPKDKFDLVLLMFDSINYLKDEKEIKILLNNVYNTLTEKGIFIFDISTIFNTKENFDGFINYVTNDNCDFIHESHFDYKKFIQTTKLTFYSKVNCLYEKKVETHKQKIYRTKEIVKLLEKSQLSLIGIYGLLSDKNLYRFDWKVIDKNYARLCFVLGK